jgi:CBS domain-containing protein
VEEPIRRATSCAGGVRDIMVTEPDTIEPDAPLSEAAEMLLGTR